MRHRRPAFATLGLATSLALATPACLLTGSAYESAQGSTGDSSTGTNPTGPATGGDGAGGDTSLSGSGGDPTTSSGHGGGSSSGGAGGFGGTGGSGGGPVLGDTCPGIPISIVVYSEVVIGNGDTTLAKSDYGASCGGGGSPEVVYAVTVKGKGYLSAELQADSPFNGMVYVRTACMDNNSELGCGKTPAPMLVEKDSVAYVFVDGISGSSGTFTLRLYLNGCGNGTLEPDHEECDDGNIQLADGCDLSCNVECDCPVGVADCVGFEDNTTHHCYALVKGSDAKWVDAKTTCEGWKGHLAVLATQAEIDKVKPSLSSGASDIWIGGSDLAQDGTFTWVNGEPWIYTNGSFPWLDHFAAANEPNGGTNENCVEIYKSNGRLNDENCEVSEDYLCERPPAGEQVSSVEP